MKAISLWQPWASLIAIGEKPFETRSWSPPPELIGQTIAIHAAKKVDKEACALAEDLVYNRRGKEIAAKLAALDEGIDDRLLQSFGAATLAAGCIVCTARLDAAFLLGEPAEGTARPAARVVKRLISRPMPECFTVRYDAYGNYEPGRWAWLLTNITPMRPPVAAVGRQGFFELPQGWMTEDAA